jgi:hypothetical protein
MLAAKPGVSPDSRKRRDKRIKRKMEIIWLAEKARLIFLISLIPDLPAIADPAAEAMSHDPKKMPVMSS